MSTRTVTYDLTLISGSAAASKVVTFDLLTPYAARSADTVVQISFSSTADENGEGTVTLAVPSSGAYLYNCTLPDGQSFRFSLEAGSATTLHALMAATVGSTVTSADAITAAVDAAITTHNALTTNVHGIADTSDIEPALGNPDADGYVLSSTTGGTRSWVAQSAGASDVGDLTTTTGSSTDMLRVAAAGGLEYRTTAQVLGDIGAAPTASPTFTGTVTAPTIVGGVIKPSSDSTTALQLANAAGAAVVTVDTTNQNVGIGKSTGITQKLWVKGGLRVEDPAAFAYFTFSVSSSAAIWTLPAKSASIRGVSNEASPPSAMVIDLQNTSSTDGTSAGFVYKNAGGNTVSGVFGVFDSQAGNSGFLSFWTRAAAESIGEKMRLSAAGILDFRATMGNSTKTVGTDAPADWVEVQIGGTTYYLPAYAA